MRLPPYLAPFLAPFLDLRFALRLATLILSLPLLYLVAGLFGAMLPGVHVPAQGTPTERIGLLRGPIHYDFLLPLTPGLHWLDLPPAALDRLARAIRADLEAVPQVMPGLSLGDGDLFFRATGRFNLTRTCNVRVGDMLRAAGLRFGRWTPTPQAVDLSLWWHGTS